MHATPFRISIPPTLPKDEVYLLACLHIHPTIKSTLTHAINLHKNSKPRGKCNAVYIKGLPACLPPRQPHEQTPKRQRKKNLSYPEVVSVS